MGTVIFAGQANSRDPFVNQTCILSGAYVSRMVCTARKGIIFQRAAAQFEPFEQAGASIVHQLKLDWPAGLLLYNCGPGPNFSIANDVTDPDLHQVAAAQLAIDGEIEESPIPNPSVLIKKKAYCPDLAGLRRSDRCAGWSSLQGSTVCRHSSAA